MPSVDELCRSHLDLKWHFNPVDASQAGAAAHDARFGTFGAEPMRAHLAAFRSLAGAVEELDTTGLPDEIDRTALLDDIRVLLFRFEHERPHERQPGFWLSHLFGGVHALLSRRGDAALTAPAALARLAAAPALLDEARATLREPPLVFVDAALASLGGGGELLARAAAHYAGAAPGLAPELTEATQRALEALAAFGRALSHDVAPSQDPVAHAVGEEQFERRLHHEHALGGGAPELWRYGLHLLEETEAQVTEAARVVDASRPWRDVVERLRADVPQGDLLETFRDEIGRVRAFLAERGVVPDTDVVLEVEPTPGFLVSSVPFAAYQRPPAELGGPGRFLVTLPQPGTDAAPVSRHELPTLVAHEAFPGHHLQVSRAQQLDSEVRRHLGSALMTEGWALYAESLLDELGYYSAPEARLFHLLNRQWRAARIVIDVGLHTRAMPPAEAVDRLLAAMPMERRQAEAEVRRYCAMPTYQLSYAVGRRDILSLRDAWTARHGAGRLRDFHDSLLSYGGLPVSLARWGMGFDA